MRVLALLVLLHLYMPLPEGCFNFTHLTWKKDVDPRTQVQRQKARIPKSRLADFVVGEQQRGGCNFTTARTAPATTVEELISSGVLVRKDTPLFSCLYICNYGGHVRSTSNATDTLPAALKEGQRRSKKANGESIKQPGCMCRFKAVIYAPEPEIVVLYYFESEHVNAVGQICHGPTAEILLQQSHKLAPHLSAECKEAVCLLLRENPEMSNKCIQQSNTDRLVKGIMKRKGVDCEEAMALLEARPPRDYFLNEQDIQNIRRPRDEEEWRLKPDEAASVRAHVQNRPANVFEYQEQKIKKGVVDKDGRPVEEAAFRLGIMTPWQLEKAVKYGKRGPILLDSTFGTNKLMFPLLSLLVMDHFINGIPVAWAIISNEQEVTVEGVLAAWKAKVQAHDPTFRPSCFIVDDANATINAIRKLWPDVPIYLCNWHVKRAWLKNLVTKVKDPVVRKQMFVDLVEVMQCSCGSQANSQEVSGFLMAKVQEFCKRYASQPSFVDYLNRHWVSNSKLEMWANAFRNTTNTAGQTGTQAVEAYHFSLKYYGLRPKLIRGRRIDWLANELVVKVLPNYRRKAIAKENGMVRNDRQETSTRRAIEGASRIPQADVQCVDASNGKMYRIRSQTRPELWHNVSGVLTTWAACDCEHGNKGFLCKHQVRSLQAEGMSDVRILHDLGTNLGQGCKDRALQAACASSHSLLAESTSPLLLHTRRVAGLPKARASVPGVVDAAHQQAVPPSPLHKVSASASTTVRMRSFMDMPVQKGRGKRGTDTGEEVQPPDRLMRTRLERVKEPQGFMACLDHAIGQQQQAGAPAPAPWPAPPQPAPAPWTAPAPGLAPPLPRPASQPLPPSLPTTHGPPTLHRLQPNLTHSLVILATGSVGVEEAARMMRQMPSWAVTAVQKLSQVYNREIGVGRPIAVALQIVSQLAVNAVAVLGNLS